MTASAAARAEAEVFGHACALLRANPLHRAQPLARIWKTLTPAIRLGQFECGFDASGRPAAFVAWALLDEAVERRTLRAGRVDLHPSEWNEGDRLWIVHFVVRPDHLKPMLRHLRDVVFAGRHGVTYLRVKPGGPVAKQVTRSDHSTFFLQPSADVPAFA